MHLKWSASCLFHYPQGRFVPLPPICLSMHGGEGEIPYVQKKGGPESGSEWRGFALRERWVRAPIRFERRENAAVSPSLYRAIDAYRVSITRSSVSCVAVTLRGLSSLRVVPLRILGISSSPFAPLLRSSEQP